MDQIENNAYFWQKLDSLYYSSSVVIERPKYSKHPKHPDMTYPVDYGYLSETIASDGSQIDVFFGSASTKQINAIAVSSDILKRDCEVKLLIGCTTEEEKDIMHMLNVTDYQKAILIRRSSDTSNWGVTE